MKKIRQSKFLLLTLKNIYQILDATNLVGENK